MQPRTPDKPGSELSSNRISSFGRFIKKSYSLSKKPSTPSSETLMVDLATNAPVYTRQHRHHNPTEADLKNHAAALQTALNDAWPRRHYSRYRNARALLICWADNDSTDVPVVASPHSPLQLSRVSPSPVPSGLSFESNPTSLARMSSETNARKSSCTTGQSTRQGPFVPAAYQLAGVLERRYGIQAQVWMIPSLESPSDMLAGKVKQFVEEYGGPDNLLIFWYGGHAEFVGAAPKEGAPGSDTSVGEIIWYGLDELGVPARAITKTLGLARADVLMLNDSPFAQHAYTGHISGPGTFELLGSGSTNSEPDTTREGSFTRTLALMLDSPFLASRGVSVLELHRKLLDMESPSQPISRASCSTSDRGNALIVARAQKTMRTPIYAVYCQISQSARLESDAQRNIVLSRFDASLAAERNHARTVGEPRVRLDIKLERPYLDVRRWKEWIVRAPADAEGVSVKVSWS